MRIASLAVVLFAAALSCQEPAAWKPLWNGKDLSGWRGQRHIDPRQLAAMPPAEREKLLAEDLASARTHWSVVDGELVNDGEGAYLTTEGDHGDIEFELEYRTVALADSGIYLRGTPQVQIWDTTEKGGKWNLGADKGSGGLWNNKVHQRMPLVHADRPFGEWNQLRIRQVGELTWVWLNEKLVVDGIVMENFWDRSKPLYRTGPIQLQTHGGEIRFRNLRLREIGADEASELLAARGNKGFEGVFDGKTLEGWAGAVDDYEVVDGAIRCKPGRGGNLFTKERYADFTARLQFRLPPGGNNGLAIRFSGEGNPAFDAMEIQVLDDAHPKYATLKEWQYCGSVYSLVAAHRGYVRPAGEWNFEEVTVQGSRVKVVLNGTTIIDTDVAKATPAEGKEHKGRSRTEGHFGFAGHNDPVEFRAIAIRRL